MGLFRRTHHKDEMRNCLKSVMLEYIKEHPRAADDVIPIFSDAELMIRKCSERQIVKMLKMQHINSECAALNIVHNMAIARLTPKRGADFIASEDHAYDLCGHINKLKFAKKYQSKQTYDENERVALELSLIPPLGHW